MASYYIYKDCNTNIEYSSSTEATGSLTIDSIYQLEITDGMDSLNSCFTILTGDSGFYSSTTISGPFETCFGCTTEIPRSANTESFNCFDPCSTGNPVILNQPHPVWTDGYGTPVTQLNSVTLGGTNGLNS